MAADTWVSISLSSGVGDPGKQHHSVVAGGPSNGDVAFGFDHTKLTTLNQASVVLDIVRSWLLGAGFK